MTKQMPQNGKVVQSNSYGTQIRFFNNGLCEALFQFNTENILTAATFSKQVDADIYKDQYYYAPNHVCIKEVHFKNNQTIGHIIENHPNGQIKSISPKYLYDPRFSHYDNSADPGHRIKDGVAREFDVNGNELIEKRQIYIKGRVINRLFQNKEQIDLLAEFLETQGYQLQKAVTQDVREIR